MPEQLEIKDNQYKDDEEHADGAEYEALFVHPNLKTKWDVNY